MHVIAPASSANLGPGFDTLGLALDLPFEVIEGQSASGEGHGSQAAPRKGFLQAEARHPAKVAFVEAGGDPRTDLWWRSPIPPGRGIGFSGAARVAGAYAALAGARGSGPVAHESAVSAAFRVAARLEGHPDNAAASAFGGMTVAVGDTALRVPVPVRVEEALRVVTWSPAEGTSTNSSRAQLGDTTPLPIAISSIGRSSLWVAAMASGRLDALREAARDELHQPTRLAVRPDTAAVLEACLEEPSVLAAWLSGSGPTVAALVGSDEDAKRLSVALVGRTHPVHTRPSGGEARVRILAIDVRGVRQIPD